MRIKGDAEGTAKVLNAISKYSKTKMVGNATDEEVKDFISIFLTRTHNINYRISSYSLKHMAERTIGHIFYHNEWYKYVSNTQFKRCMHEMGFRNRPNSLDAENECYNISLNSKLQIYIDLANNPQIHGLELDKKF